MDNRLAPKSINALQQASMARAGPNTPAWWSDTNASWDPETGLDIYGNYGGPIGTSGPMGAGGGDRGDAANIANGWTQPSTGQTPQQPPAGSYASGTSGGWGPYSNWITPPVPGTRGYAPPGYMISPADGIIKIEDFHAWYGNKPTQPAVGNPNGPTQPPAGSYGTSGGAPQGYEPSGYVERPFDNFMPNAAAQGYNNPRGSMSTYAPSQRSGSYFGENNRFTPNYGFNMNYRF